MAQREITAAIVLPLFVALLYWGSPIWFYFLSLAAILLGTREYFNITSKIGVEGYPMLGLVMSFLLSLCFYFEGRYLQEWMMGSFLVIFGVWYFKDGDSRMALDQIAYTLIGVLWVAGTLGYFILIRNLESGRYFLFFVFFVVWTGDTLAYYGGRKFGKHPFFPSISPRKTIEGAFCGLAANTSAGALAHFWFLKEILLTHCLIMGLICGIIGQFGDLAESVLKRNALVKDSGGLIPGHGGVLDRVDSLMLAGPAFYFYHKWVIS